MNPLRSVRGSLAAGFILALALAWLLAPTSFHELGLARWLHLLSGIVWVGLLLYFNAVQTPALAAAMSDNNGAAAAAIQRYAAPRALSWFRWASILTWLTGAWYLGRSGNFIGAFTLGAGGAAFNAYQFIIGAGAWLGTIMLFNVWVLIWPNQKKILGIVSASDEEKARAKKVAGYASRVNLLLSVPMIMCMASATHGLPL